MDRGEWMHCKNNTHGGECGLRSDHDVDLRRRQEMKVVSKRWIQSSFIPSIEKAR